MTTEISSWQKAKDVLLMGFFSLLTLGAIAIVSLLNATRSDLADLKLSIAVYQANQESLKADHERLRQEVAQRFSEDRIRMDRIEGRR